MRADSDADLCERFRQLREQDNGAEPAFDDVLMRASARVQRGRSKVAWTAGGFALAATIGLVLILRPPATTLDAEVAMSAWPTQTDFLLAGASDSSYRLIWPPSPTSGLGRHSFNHDREGR